MVPLGALSGLARPITASSLLPRTQPHGPLYAKAALASATQSQAPVAALSLRACSSGQSWIGAGALPAREEGINTLPSLKAYLVWAGALLENLGPTLAVLGVIVDSI